MPSNTTHLEFSKAVYNTLNSGKQLVITNDHMFYLGSQGPDILFFYNFGISINRISKIGSMMHSKKIYEAVKYMHDHINGDDDLLSYYYGYLCHYALDSVAHPLVYHRSRYSKLVNETEMGTHFRIEAFIDRYILNINGKDTINFETDKKLVVDKKSLEKLGILYSNMIKEIFNLQVSPKQIEKCCKDMVTVIKVLKPDSTAKYNVFKKLDNFSKNPHKISAFMLYNEFENQDYILNIRREEFTNIHDEEFKYNDSFMDLYEKGIIKAKHLIENPLNKNDYNLTFDGSKVKD